MAFISYIFKIKTNKSQRKKLRKFAESVNIVWNYCNETSFKNIKNNRKWLSNYDLQKLTAGTSKELNIPARTISETCRYYVNNRDKFKKRKLRWRTGKKLGWIPVKNTCLYINNDLIIYNNLYLKLWKSREINGIFKIGCFKEDSKGHWYIDLICETVDKEIFGTQELGLDLGIKTQVTLSDGRKFNRENYTKKYEKKLAIAQRAKKKKQITAIHAKIKNCRKDWNHKVANEILKDANLIVVGKISSSKLTKTRFAKSVYDAGWFQLKSILAYKSQRLGVEFKEVNESWTTRTCSNCFERSGPQGLSGLSVREWICQNCLTEHDRDVNAAQNILRLGYQTPTKGIC